MQDLDPNYVINSEAALRARFPPTHEKAKLKCIDHLDRYAQDFIRRSPFLCIGTQAPDGMADVSPRGDPAGFVKVLSESVLLVPDRPGNNRLDTQRNIIANPSLGLLFMVPGFDDTLRVNGTAQITTDPKLLDLMIVKDRAPIVAIAVEVQEVFLHCAKAFRRSALWDPSQRQDRSEMPSLMQMIHAQTDNTPMDATEQAKMDDDLEAAYRDSMY